MTVAWGKDSFFIWTCNTTYYLRGVDPPERKVVKVNLESCWCKHPAGPVLALEEFWLLSPLCELGREGKEHTAATTTHTEQSVKLLLGFVLSSAHLSLNAAMAA